MLLLPSASHTNICLQWLFFCVAVCVLVDDREVVALSMGLLLAPFLRSTVHILHVCMSPCRASSSSLCTAAATTAVNTTTLGGYDSAMHTRRFNSNNNYSHYYTELHGPEYTTTTSRTIPPNLDSTRGVNRHACITTTTYTTTVGVLCPLDGECNIDTPHSLSTR